MMFFIFYMKQNCYNDIVILRTNFRRELIDNKKDTIMELPKFDLKDLWL